MAEESRSHSGDSHDPNIVDSAFSNDDGKQDEPIREVGGGVAAEGDADVGKTGEQQLEKSNTARSDRDPKLVYLLCLPFFAEETNQPHR